MTRVRNLPCRLYSGAGDPYSDVVIGRVLATGPPITIFEPIFARLHDNLAYLQHLDPDSDTYEDVAKLCSLMSGYYSSEHSRLADAQRLLHKILGISLDSSSLAPVIGFHKCDHHSDATPDFQAAVRGGGHLLVFIIEEDRNEFLVRGDPVSQAAHAYAKIAKYPEAC